VSVVKDAPERLILLHAPLWTPLVRLSLGLNLLVAALVLGLLSWTGVAVLVALVGVVALLLAARRLELVRIEVDHAAGSLRLEGFVSWRKFKQEINVDQISHVQVEQLNAASGARLRRPELHFRDGRGALPLFVHHQKGGAAERLAAQLNARLVGVALPPAEDAARGHDDGS